LFEEKDKNLLILNKEKISENYTTTLINENINNLVIPFEKIRNNSSNSNIYYSLLNTNINTTNNSSTNILFTNSASSKNENNNNNKNNINFTKRKRLNSFENFFNSFPNNFEKDNTIMTNQNNNINNINNINLVKKNEDELFFNSFCFMNKDNCSNKEDYYENELNDFFNQNISSQTEVIFEF
jgi:hypothetical protein